MKNILIVGVGGQGTLLTSRVLGRVALDLGYDVKLSEVHGMAQRGGSVVTHVRFGDKVNSPLVEVGEADIIMAFEELEALRWIHYLKKDGTLIVNRQKIKPMPVIMGAEKYPEETTEKLEQLCSNVEAIHALDIAKKIGNIKVVNTILIGALARQIDIDEDQWIQALKNTIPQKLLDINMKAFYEGYQLYEESNA